MYRLSLAKNVVAASVPSFIAERYQGLADRNQQNLRSERQEELEDVVGETSEVGLQWIAIAIPRGLARPLKALRSERSDPHDLASSPSPNTPNWRK
jgi:hypothetical protein